MDDGVLCTLDELTGLVESALAVDYPGAPTGRVRDVPDQRAIRWYVTRGLVDRPVTRGRVALYGRRHLLQLVAIKRRQAEGRSLADIQAELAGATDDTLATVARISPGAVTLPARDGHAAEPARPRRARFWADRPAPAAAMLSEPPAPWNAGPADPPVEVAPSAGHRLSHAGPSGQHGLPSHAGERDLSEPLPHAVEQAMHMPAPHVVERDRYEPAAPVTLRGIRLAPGITLLIEDGAGRAADPAAIRAAARPLLDLLATGEQAAASLRPNLAEE